MKYDIAYHSVRGARPTNQDRIGIAERDNAVLMVVADGLGGHRGGEIASEIVAQTLVHSFQTVRSPVIGRPSAFLALGILQAHQIIRRRAEASLNTIQPRTTCVVALVQRGYVYWAHVGDSRLYHFRGGQMRSRTQDHSTVEEMRQEGLVTEDEMLNHPQKGRLTKCVGGPTNPIIALGEETALARDDVLLLCSDGVWEAFTPEQLGRALDRDGLDEGVEELLFNAEQKMRDGCDNLSAVALRWRENAPTDLPLQGNARVEVDERMLFETAASGKAAAKTQAPPNSDMSRHDVDAEIRALEEYLRRHEPKP